MMADLIRAPRCPGCDAEPVIRFDRQYFCGSGEDDCNVFCWDPTQDPAQFKATANVIDLGTAWYRSSGGGGRG